MATLLALGGLALGAYQTIQGQSDKNKAEREISRLEEGRKEFEVPNSIEEQVALLRNRAQQGLPGEDLIGQQIQQGTAQGVAASRQASTSASDLLGATTQLYGNQTQAMTDLQIQSARQQSANQLDLAQGLGIRGEFEDKAFTYNEAIPFQVKMNELMGIKQSGYDAITGGIGTALGGLTSAFGGSQGGGSTVGGGSQTGSTISNPSGYGIQGIDPALNPLNLQSSY